MKWAAALWLALALGALPAAADDAGTEDAGATEDAGEPIGLQPSTTPDRFACAVAPGAARKTAAPALILVGGAALLFTRRRRRAHTAFALLFTAAILGSAPASADEPPASAGTPATPPASAPPAAKPDPLDQAPLAWPRGARRRFVLSYDLFTIAEARYGLTLQIVPTSHHALLINAYYMTTHTNADANNAFQGPGMELGYHYFFGHDGARGLHLGPSLLLGAFDGIPARGDTVHFVTWGLAADIGWQALLLDRVALGISAGAQYSQPTVSLPVQELPAGLYANRGIHPRLNISLGIAF